MRGCTVLHMGGPPLVGPRSMASQAHSIATPTLAATARPGRQVGMLRASAPTPSSYCPQRSDTAALGRTTRRRCSKACGYRNAVVPRRITRGGRNGCATARGANSTSISPALRKQSMDLFPCRTHHQPPSPSPLLPSPLPPPCTCHAVFTYHSAFCRPRPALILPLHCAVAGRRQGSSRRWSQARRRPYFSRRKFGNSWTLLSASVCMHLIPLLFLTNVSISASHSSACPASNLPLPFPLPFLLRAIRAACPLLSSPVPLFDHFVLLSLCRSSNR